MQCSKICAKVKTTTLISGRCVQWDMVLKQHQVSVSTFFLASLSSVLSLVSWDAVWMGVVFGADCSTLSFVRCISSFQTQVPILGNLKIPWKSNHLLLQVGLPNHCFFFSGDLSSSNMNQFFLKWWLTSRVNKYKKQMCTHQGLHQPLTQSLSSSSMAKMSPLIPNTLLSWASVFSTEPGCWEKEQTTTHEPPHRANQPSTHKYK